MTITFTAFMLWQLPWIVLCAWREWHWLKRFEQIRKSTNAVGAAVFNQIAKRADAGAVTALGDDGCEYAISVHRTDRIEGKAALDWLDLLYDWQQGSGTSVPLWETDEEKENGKWL